MSFVLEGPDGAGKSTLALTLAREYGLTIDHFGPPKQPPLREYLHWLIQRDSWPHRRVIDRFHLGEAVYGPVWRKTNNLTRMVLSTIEWALMVRGYTLVHVTRPLDRLVATLDERGDDYDELRIEDMPIYLENYRKVLELSFMPRLTYNFESPNLVAWSGELTRRPTKLAIDYRDQMRCIAGTGSLQPEHILVGERTNIRLAADSRGTPFALGSSAEWLCDALWHLEWQGTSYITNAKKDNGDDVLIGREIRWLRAQAMKYENPMPRVYALGKTAARVLRAHHLDYTELPHPQYHRRFHYPEGSETYATLLRTS